MKLSIFFALFISIVYGQEVDCSNSDEVEHTGPCEVYYENGNLKILSHFKDGFRHGKHTEYYKNGHLAAVANFNEDQLIGSSYRYNQDSVVYLELHIDSTETGNFTYYSFDGKQILTTGQFKNGYKDGTWSYYDENGNLRKTEIHYADSTIQNVNKSSTSSQIYIPYGKTIEFTFFDEFQNEGDLLMEKMINFPDVEAEFPGGISKMFEYLGKNISYPNKALKNNDQGKVFVQFVVEANGKITNVEVIRGVSKELDAESIRVIKKMPKWKPAEHKGVKVKSKIRIPINFTL